MKKPVYYINGKFVPKSEAVLPIFDLSIARGYGVFDFLVTYNQRPFLLDHHLQRLENSAKLIEINVPWERRVINDTVNKTLEKNLDGKEKSIRILITGGKSKDYITPAKKPSLIVIIEDRKYLPKTCYKNGVKIITVDQKRSLPGAKTLNYISAIKALCLAKKKGAIEAIYVDKKNNKVFEGTTSNLFIVKNRKIYTSSSDILFGITRGVVVKLCERQYSVIQKTISIDQLSDVDEAFLTASNKEVLPVVRINNKKVGNGKVGIITKEIMKIFENYTKTNNWK